MFMAEQQMVHMKLVSNPYLSQNALVRMLTLQRASAGSDDITNEDMHNLLIAGLETGLLGDVADLTVDGCCRCIKGQYGQGDEKAQKRLLILCWSGAVLYSVFQLSQGNGGNTQTVVHLLLEAAQHLLRLVLHDVYAGHQYLHLCHEEQAGSIATTGC